MIGASGAGKTAAVKAIERRDHAWLRCFHFDSVGVPTAEVMAAFAEDGLVSFRGLVAR